MIDDIGNCCFFLPYLFQSFSSCFLCLFLVIGMESVRLASKRGQH